MNDLFGDVLKSLAFVDGIWFMLVLIRVHMWLGRHP